MSKRVLPVDGDFPGVDFVCLRKVILEFRGDGRILEASLGAWLLGSLIGGRGLELIHTRDVLERYARTLQFDNWRALRDQLPENGPKTKDLALLKLRRRFQSVISALVSSVPNRPVTVSK